MQIWVLGTLEVSHNGRPIAVRGQLPRRLLALLARTPGRDVDVDQLVFGLWGDRTPGAAVATLQAHVARLRRDLGGADLVRTGPHGYRLDIEPNCVDALRFERAIDEGLVQLAQSRFDEASTILTEALQAWRGTPYAEFADCEVLEEDRRRLEDRRLEAVEGRITADLTRPGTPSPLAELEALVRWHPTRESLWGLLMTSLYRAGRQGDALGCYQRARGVLAEELGVEPGPALADLERRILGQDPTLETVPFALPGVQRRSYPDSVTLVEREPQLADLAAASDEARAGAGRLVLVPGEAGAGKSALVRTWTVSLPLSTPVLWGACDPLSSPRALGPLQDVSVRLGGRVPDLLRAGERDGLFEAVLEALGAQPSVLVIEDLHWADTSTHDLIRFLARRIGDSPVVVVVTYRDDDLGPADPVRVMVGDLSGQPTVRRIAVPTLSLDAVTELVSASVVPIDAEQLLRETGGNAFFVTEVLATGGQHLPPSVQDAVLARVHRLPQRARLALEVAAVAGSRIEPSLLNGLPEADLDAVDACVSAGMLLFEAPAYTFRHELVRQAVLSGIAPGRLGALHWQVLEVLAELPMSPRPWARLADHAANTGDPAATLKYGMAAGDAAAALGAHREAAAQYGRAMPYAELLDVDDRITLLQRRATECAICDQHDEAVEAWEAAIALLEETDRELEIVDALLGIEYSLYVVGDSSRRDDLIDRAYDLVAGTPPTPQHARVLLALGRRDLLRSRFADSLPWFDRALEMGESVGEHAVVARARGNRAWPLFWLGDAERGRAESREALAYAVRTDEVEMASRTFQTVAGLAWMSYDYDEALEYFDDGIRYSDEHDLHGDLLCGLASRVSLKLDMGLWDDAVAEATDLLYVRNTGRASRIDGLGALALVGARRGDRADVWELLDQMQAWIERSPTLDYQATVAMARGEAHLLEGDDEAVGRVALRWYQEAVDSGDADWIGRLGLLVWRAGFIESPPEGMGEAERWSLSGEHRRAAQVWIDAGAPYNAAWALLDSDDEVDVREARARFEQLRAAVLVARCDAKLRGMGAKVPRGARASTQANVGGLTDREVEVLALIDEGLRNADIAERLHLSQKTVGHHVSAILGKLGAASRTEAVRRARDLAAVS
jgi:DNA-binding SARP family transcriptional activator/DNA-binding CsgD family transcriptional regulator/tetratricopeptide (TPR) repeat protein